MKHKLILATVSTLMISNAYAASAIPEDDEIVGDINTATTVSPSDLLPEGVRGAVQTLSTANEVIRQNPLLAQIISWGVDAAVNWLGDWLSGSQRGTHIETEDASSLYKASFGIFGTPRQEVTYEIVYRTIDGVRTEVSRREIGRRAI